MQPEFSILAAAAIQYACCFSYSVQDLRYQQITSVQDDSFAPEARTDYQLLLTLGQHDLKLAVADLDSGQIMALEHYHFPQTYSWLQAAEQMQQLFAQHAFLGRTTWKRIRCGIYAPSFLLLPSALYQRGHETDYFRLACPFDEFHERVQAYRHEPLEAVMLYSANKFVLQPLQSLRSAEELQMRPVSSAFLEGLLKTQARQAVPQLYGLVEAGQALLVLLIDGQVRFCNAFTFTTPEDLVYFVLLSMQEHKLSPDQDLVTLWGELTPDSALFTLLRKYLRHVKLGRQPAELQYSQRIADLLPHRYFDLFSLYFCN